jgi:hypothetical protein
LEKILIKNKIKKLIFFVKNYFYKILLRLKTFVTVILSDPSPHRQQVGSATLPQGESDDTESFTSVFKI